MTQPSNPLSRRLALALFGAVLLAAVGCSSADSFMRELSGAVGAAADNALAERTPDLLVGDVERGEALFLHGREPAPACQNCHAHTASAVFSLGPNLRGVAERASTRIAGMEADEYLRRSILFPNEFTVPGYRSIMYPDYASSLSEQDLADVIAFLKQL
ncbi:MAG: c-type cytochrome [Anaerolineae bacterium]